MQHTFRFFMATTRSWLSRIRSSHYLTTTGQGNSRQTDKERSLAAVLSVCVLARTLYAFKPQCLTHLSAISTARGVAQSTGQTRVGKQIAAGTDASGDSNVQIVLHGRQSGLITVYLLTATSSQLGRWPKRKANMPQQSLAVAVAVSVADSVAATDQLKLN